MSKITIPNTILLLLIFTQNVFANNGSLFTVAASGAPADINLKLCLNAKGIISCQNYTASGLDLNIITNIINHTYPFAGIKIDTPGYKIAHLGTDCTPLANGYCMFSVSNTASKNIFLLADNTTLSISPNTLPAATINVAYSQTVTASGGLAPYTYAISTGELPIGVSLDATTGVISGTPTVKGDYSFTVTATDSDDDTGSQAYSISIQTLTLTPTTLPPATIDVLYVQTITVTGSSGIYTCLISEGTFPDGLTLNAFGPCTISGFASPVGTYDFTIKAIDDEGNTGSQPYTLDVIE